MNVIQQGISQISMIRISDIVDIVLVSFILYFVISLMRRTKTSKVFTGILILLAALWLSGELKLYTVNYLLRNVVQIGLLALVVLFQPEIRRFLEKLGTSTQLMRLLTTQGRERTTDYVITQVVLACTDLAATKTGALIIFERDNPLNDQVRTGTVIDASVTAELLKNIFYPKAPLHDGAAIIRNGRIEAAGCMLPLSSNANLSKDLGMRHRAGLGISEATDALVVIVSEETGAVSVAEGGMLKRHLTKETFEKILRNGLTLDEPEPTGFLRMLRKDKDSKNGTKN